MPSIPVVDLHRSRDHGIVDYVTANKFCSKQNGTHIAKLESADKLKKLYRYFTWEALFPRTYKMVSEFWERLVNELPFSDTKQTST